MIAVDWGTSSLRAYRLDDGGAIRDQRRSDRGVLACQGAFAAELVRHIEGWDDHRILMSGMAGGRGGWKEVPYVPCPGTLRDIAASVVPLESDAPGLAGRDLRIVPGMIDSGSSSVADMMRGEETQILGLIERLGEGRHTICLPGTHSKWVQVHDGAVVSIRTMMTGETYALFRKHSLLAHLMSADEPPLAMDAFDEGLERSGEAGGLLHHLFGVRAKGLLGGLSEKQSPSYLSGLLIGHEIRAQACPARVHLIGNTVLLTAYVQALQAFGVEVHRHGEDLAATGLYRLARAMDQGAPAPTRG